MATGTIILPVQAAQLVPSASGASITTTQNIWRLAFDPNAKEYAAWQFRMPATYSSSPVVKIQYIATANATGAGLVDFEVAIMAISDGDSQTLNVNSYDTVNAGSATVPTTDGYLDEVSITVTNNDSVAAGDYVRLQIARDATDATNDTVGGDIEVVNVSFQYTTT